MRFFYRPGHPKADEFGFVSGVDLAEMPMDPPKASNAPVMAGRFYENTAATDGTDIGSRAKHKEYMRQNGLTTMDDYTQSFKKAEERRNALRNGDIPSKTRRELLERTWHEKVEK